MRFLTPYDLADLRRATARAALTAAAFFLAGSAFADQDARSSDGQWNLHAKVADSLAVGASAEALVDVSPAGGGKACPTVGSVVFEMPAHGHGGKVDPKVSSLDGCHFKVTDLSPSMGGAWRLRLVLKSDGKSSNADFNVNAK
jgi:hypothetical protein